MKIRHFLLIATALFGLVSAASGQSIVTLADASGPENDTKMTAAEDTVFKRDALPKVRKKLMSDTCTESVEIAGVAHGAFSTAGTKQALVFYQFCQTGNGLGWAGLVLMENDKVIGNFIADSGWTRDIRSVPDINRNGLDEFTLYWGGGLHQGEGGTGVDLMEFSGTGLKGIGWFQSEKYGDTQATTIWKVTAKTGKEPVYYKQQYYSGEGEKYKKVGVNTPFKLTKTVSEFEAIK